MSKTIGTRHEHFDWGSDDVRAALALVPWDPFYPLVRAVHAGLESDRNRAAWDALLEIGYSPREVSMMIAVSVGVARLIVHAGAEDLTYGIETAMNVPTRPLWIGRRDLTTEILHCCVPRPKAHIRLAGYGTVCRRRAAPMDFLRDADRRLNGRPCLHCVKLLAKRGTDAIRDAALDR